MARQHRRAEFRQPQRGNESRRRCTSSHPGRRIWPS
jgi:hypothetical protein